MGSELNLPSLAEGPQVIFPYVKLVSQPLPLLIIITHSLRCVPLLAKELEFVPLKKSKHSDKKLKHCSVLSMGQC